MTREVLDFLKYSNAMPMLAIVCGLGIPFIAQYWYKLRVKQWEMSLKHTMLEKGMSAEEIRMVVEASAKGSEKRHC